MVRGTEYQEKPVLHFANANSYPPDCYHQFFNALETNYRVVALNPRPLWQFSSPQEVKSWHLFAQDLIDFLDQKIQKPVYGVGHSMGAIVTLMAAIKCPHLFKKIVLIEPPILSLPQVFLMRLTPFFLKAKIPLIRRALNRPDIWKSKQEAYQFHRPKKVFARFSDDVLWDYIDYGVEAKENQQVGLVYSKEWEVRCYETVPYFWHLLQQYTKPLLGIRGEFSKALSSENWKKWEQYHQLSTLIEVPQTGHLIPFERPQFLAQIISNWLNNNQYD